MKVITEVGSNVGMVKKALSRFGHNVEHNLHHYLAIASAKTKPVFFSFPRDRGVLASREKGKLDIFPGGVLAPKEERMGLLEKVLSRAFQGGAKKVVVEVDGSSRKQILSSLKGSGRFKALRTSYILYWPTFDMERFDVKLPGRRWKKMRNIRNRFVKQHLIRIVDSRKVPQEKLKEIMRQWLRKRNHGDTVKKDYYLNLINSNFKGLGIAKTIYVDGEPCTITAGWDVPNGKKHYYSAIGILNYRHKGLGEFANLMDLIHLKRKGYKLVDFGGSDESLLTFKNKFRPHQVYKTYSFSIVRK